MDVDVSLPLMKALDLSWHTLAECFESHELLMKQDLVDRYFPNLENEGTGEVA
jgi:V/A-type H+-transporting ATPase subunit B